MDDLKREIPNTTSDLKREIPDTTSHVDIPDKTINVDIPPEPTPPAPVNTEPKPISLSESGNPVGESAQTPEPTQSHEPIPTGDSSSEVSADAPQIISSPALPDVKIPQDSKHIDISGYAGDIQPMDSHATDIKQAQTPENNNIPAPTIPPGGFAPEINVAKNKPIDPDKEKIVDPKAEPDSTFKNTNPIPPYPSGEKTNSSSSLDSPIANSELPPASTPGFMDKVMKLFGRNKS